MIKLDEFVPSTFIYKKENKWFKIEYKFQLILKC